MAPGAQSFHRRPSMGRKSGNAGRQAVLRGRGLLNWQCKRETGCSGLMKPFLPRIRCRMSVSPVFITQPTGSSCGRMVHTPHVEKSYNERVKKSIEQNNSVLNAFDLSKRGIGMGSPVSSRTWSPPKGSGPWS